MSYFSRFSPFRAIRDLRFFLSQRQRHELIFFFISLGITTALLAGFYVDSRVERVYKREIQYFDSWSLDRTDAQIVAKQAVDKVERDKRIAARKAREAERQAAFKRLDDSMTRWGL
ncbi:hypothetical protein FBR43_14515 [Sphingomonas baiyangensis]|uniref:Uncharacterized protein n=1 Tax=Sphingomonas baiyangensis TaxID=2572576 RepID=A0A4V6WRG9_9SPHN|nr:hypothetical protein FBR43_14515 [Sphingomonas baiyangensis]